jgi:tetratricopeptide (TPR) repeat protein
MKKDADETIIATSESESETRISYAEALFHKGIYCLYNNNLKDAKSHLNSVLKHTDELECVFWQSTSFLGLVEVLLLKSNGGLHRCYQVATEHPQNPEFLLNIAYAEYILGNRKRSICALEQCLQIDAKYTMANLFYDAIGRRTRKSLIKNILGKMIRRPNRFEDINLFDILRNHLMIKQESITNKIECKP